MEESKQKYTNHLAERESEEPIEVDTFLQEDEWQSVSTEGKYLDPKEKYIRPRYTLSYNGVPFAPLGGIHGLTGQPGHGKTFTFTQLIVAILRGEFYGLRYELSRDIPQPKVLYIDTEMEKGNTQLVMLRVYEMMGWEKGSEQEQFKILWLREEVKAVERWKLTLKAINELKPTVVFLDGLIDVVGDFNDNKECQAIIYKCMATASHYGLSMWCLLHENPGSTKMVGHAGSFLERKATDVLKTKKDKESGVVQFEVSQSKARARDLDAWTFTIEDDTNHYGHPVIKEKKEKVNTGAHTYPIEDIERWVRLIAETPNMVFPMKKGDFKDALKSVSGEKNNDNLQAMLNQALNRNFVVAENPGNQKSRLLLNIEVNHAPF